MEELELLKKEFSSLVANCADFDEALRIKGRFLGKTGSVTLLFRKMKELPPEQRKDFGAALNAAKEELSRIIKEKIEELEGGGTKEGNIDLTLPGTGFKPGAFHPITMVIQEISDIFKKLGFSVASGPEIETDFYNFEALNIPPHHPARDTQDTFFIDSDHVLRTQTSGVQIRVMEKTPPPIRIIAPGKVFRVDSDVTHSPVFHQIEGLMVDKDITFRHLKYILELTLRELFGQERSIRLRPSFFPFTEPSAEVDVSCFQCNGKGCRLCSNSGWIEVLGCGMVDPNVFNAVGLDPEIYTGWAFGMGIERIAMLKYGITDIRLFYENDVRFLEQFI
jgi:phenylalanyl-tRNA synthetase alpha chain